jgi:hypothetical protein
MDTIEKVHIKEAYWANTINVNTGNIKSMDFDIKPNEKAWLFEQGMEEANKWLKKNTY